MLNAKLVLSNQFSITKEVPDGLSPPALVKKRVVPEKAVDS